MLEITNIPPQRFNLCKYVKHDILYNDCSIRRVNRKAAIGTTYHVPHTGLSALYTYILLTSCTKLMIHAFYWRTKAQRE